MERWSADARGRPGEFMGGALQTMLKFEEIMRFLVEAGFTPERLAFLKKRTYVYFRPASDGFNKE